MIDSIDYIRAKIQGKQPLQDLLEIPMLPLEFSLNPGKAPRKPKKWKKR